ncbi:MULTISPECIES: hypothetical protein [Methylobacterium]|uniref:GIY-YIG domain-containing protein n=1 Tax=Methylobacterium ajmalii TaxID=2738439 RepID=A0ABV0A2H0_9HYPH|nr:hypothetical protein [Methylobacterium aquaticum]
MSRYYADPERRRVATLIDTEVQKAPEAEKAGGWITYLIRDARELDKRGNPGVPIYVGQTKEFGRRVRSRFDQCEKAATAKDSIERRLAELLNLGIVAQYEVLERAPTRLASLVSEIRWARRCVSSAATCCTTATSTSAAAGSPYFGARLWVTCCRDRIRRLELNSRLAWHYEEPLSTLCGRSKRPLADCSARKTPAVGMSSRQTSAIPSDADVP